MKEKKTDAEITQAKPFKSETPIAFYEEPEPFQPVLPDPALRYRENRPPKKHVMLAMEVIVWIALKRAIPFSQLGCLWNSDPGLELPARELAMLEALKARAALETGYSYCVSCPTSRQSDPIPSRHQILGRDGPRTLRWLRAKYRRHHGRLITFSEMATIQHNYLFADSMVSRRLKHAMSELREALAAQVISAYGVPYGNVGMAEPSCVSHEIHHAVFIPQEVMFSLGNGLATNEDMARNDRVKRALPRYEQITFKTSDVLRVWPPRTVAQTTPQSGAKPSGLENTELNPPPIDEPVSSRTGAPGRPTSSHFVDLEFKRRCQTGEIGDTLAIEAKFLSEWLQATHAGMPKMSPRTIENRLRDAFRRHHAPRN